MLLTGSIYERENSLRNDFFSFLHKSELDCGEQYAPTAVLTLQPPALCLECLIRQTNLSGVSHLLIYSARKEEVKDEQWQETPVSFQ